MVLSTLIQKNSLLVGSEEPALSIKITFQSFLTHYDRHLENVDGKCFGWVLPCLLHSFATFVVVSPESESTYWIPYSIHIAYILNITNLIWKKVNQVFVITIKRVIYLINFFGHKTLKSVSLFYVATSFTSALPTFVFFGKYRLWLPFLINRVLNLTKLRSVMCDQYVDSSCFTLWEIISTAQTKRRPWRTRVLLLQRTTARIVNVERCISLVVTLLSSCCLQIVDLIIELVIYGSVTALLKLQH